MLFITMLATPLIGCSSKSNQKQTHSTSFNCRERLDSIKAIHTDDGYVLFEKFDQNDSYIIYATKSGLYKETIFGETMTLINDAEPRNYEVVVLHQVYPSWLSNDYNEGIGLPVLEWTVEDYDGYDDIQKTISGKMLYEIAAGQPGKKNNIICNEDGILVDGNLFLYATPNIKYVNSGIKPNDADSFKFKGTQKIFLRNFPDFPSDISASLYQLSFPSKFENVEWIYEISESGSVHITDEFIFDGRTYNRLNINKFYDNLRNSIANYQKEEIAKIMDSSIKLDDFTTAYQNNPIKSEQNYPVGSRCRLIVDLDAISKSDNPYYKYVLKSSLPATAYSYIYTNDDSFASKDYPIGCCMEATFSHFDGGQLFEFVDAEAKAYGPPSYQSDYD